MSVKSRSAVAAALDDETAPRYTVGQVAELLDVRPWFLRRLDTLGGRPAPLQQGAARGARGRPGPHARGGEPGRGPPRLRASGPGRRAGGRAGRGPPPPRHPEGGWPMRIAMVAPPWFHVPPEAYGGIEQMVADLVDGLVARGHEVVLVGAGRPGTKAQRFVPVYAEPPSARLGQPLPEVLQAAAAAAVLDGAEVDVVHDHTLAGPLLARGRAVPTVVTAHGPVTGEPGDYLARLGGTVDVVAISEAQRRLRPELNWLATVHNGIDVASYPMGGGDGGYLLFLGRFNPEKGAHLAIDAARRAGRRLVLAGKLNEPAERHYFNALVRPRLGPDVDYVGEADAATKRELYAGAEALLFPVCWEEPFGL